MEKASQRDMKYQTVRGIGPDDDGIIDRVKRAFPGYTDSALTETPASPYQ